MDRTDKKTSRCVSLLFVVIVIVTLVNVLTLFNRVCHTRRSSTVTNCLWHHHLITLPYIRYLHLHHLHTISRCHLPPPTKIRLTWDKPWDLLGRCDCCLGTSALQHLYILAAVSLEIMKLFIVVILITCLWRLMEVLKNYAALLGIVVYLLLLTVCVCVCLCVC